MDECVAGWLGRLDRWVRLHPVGGSPGHTQLGEEIGHALSVCGLAVERFSHASGELLVARGSGSGPLLGLYGHYDVEPGSTTEMLVTGGRVFGRGVADNLGPLALRLSVLERFEGRANLLWVIEPGEENGSHSLAEWLDSSGDPHADLWLDETGYFEAGGTQRVLAMGSTESLSDALGRCGAVAKMNGRATRIEQRRLRRVVSDAGFSVERLFQSAPYVAIGPNDDLSDVHGDQESLPLDTIGLSMSQFSALLDMAAGRGVR